MKPLYDLHQRQWEVKVHSSRGVMPVASEDVVHDLCKDARDACDHLTQASAEDINAVLRTLSEKLTDNAAQILAENKSDLSQARRKGLNEASLDRLTLNHNRVKVMAESVSAIAELDSPVGTILDSWDRPNGLHIEKVCVPLGVLGMIYESRPNVTIDAAALCLKSHNAVILRGGSESLRTSSALHTLVQDSLSENNFPVGAVGMIPVPDRHLVGVMLQAHKWIDLMIPRGGRGLIERVMREATMPVLAHLDGICHVFVHESANAEIARDVTYNAKMRRTGICGAAETLLIDRKLPRQTAHDVVTDLLDGGCKVVGDQDARKIDPRIGQATDSDWRTEYLDAIISVRHVDGVESAIRHINKYGSHHTDSIIAEDTGAVESFLNRIDSGIVMHNTSTQFADGGEFGMGAEIGIATGKMHARGPVGVRQLTTYKYVVRGTGQTRPDT